MKALRYNNTKVKRRCRNYRKTYSIDFYHVCKTNRLILEKMWSIMPDKKGNFNPPYFYYMQRRTIDLRYEMFKKEDCLYFMQVTKLGKYSNT